MRHFDMADVPPGSFEPFEIRLCCGCHFGRYGDVESIANPEITVDVVLSYILDQGVPGRLFVFEDLQF